jgi:ribonuclease HII
MVPGLLPGFSNLFLEAGCDEAGRGCLAGPVFAAAVILPRNFTSDDLNDSKKLNPARRNYFRERIESEALAWAVGIVDAATIDKINILNASIEAMHQAIANLPILPEFLLIDGNRFKIYRGIPYQCIIKGDSKYLNIAAASILAKTHRDEYMRKIHEEFPGYGWDRNKGYPTTEHRQAIARLGITRYHRKSFRLGKQLKISL